MRVIAEVPGIEKKNLDIDATEEEIHIKGSQDERNYNKQVKINGKIKPKSITASLRNGILEIRAEWKDKPKHLKKEEKKGFKVDIT